MHPKPLLLGFNNAKALSTLLPAQETAMLIKTLNVMQRIMPSLRRRDGQLLIKPGGAVRAMKSRAGIEDATF